LPGGWRSEKSIVSPITIGLIVLACVFGGALSGMALRLILPEGHLSADSKDVIKLGMGLTATMSALVLALLIASAKNSYDTQRNELTQMSAKLCCLIACWLTTDPKLRRSANYCVFPLSA
jgi:hypothetical protein